MADLTVETRALTRSSFAIEVRHREGGAWQEWMTDMPEAHCLDVTESPLFTGWLHQTNREARVIAVIARVA